MEQDEARYTRDELRAAQRFEKYKDAVTALLDEDKTYTVEEAEERIAAFMRGEV